MTNKQLQRLASKSGKVLTTSGGESESNQSQRFQVHLKLLEQRERDRYQNEFRDELSSLEFDDDYGDQNMYSEGQRSHSRCAKIACKDEPSRTLEKDREKQLSCIQPQKVSSSSHHQKISETSHHRQAPCQPFSSLIQSQSHDTTENTSEDQLNLNLLELSDDRQQLPSQQTKSAR